MWNKIFFQVSHSKFLFMFKFIFYAVCPLWVLGTGLANNLKDYFPIANIKPDVFAANLYCSYVWVNLINTLKIFYAVSIYSCWSVIMVGKSCTMQHKNYYRIILIFVFTWSVHYEKSLFVNTKNLLD